MKNKNINFVLFMILPGLLFLQACRAPEAYRRDADLAAEIIIREKQMEALGRTESFTITPLEKSLREKLLLEQDLPYAGPASLGSGHLEKIDHWPEKGPDYNDDRDAGLQISPIGNGTMVLTLVDALQVGARHNREYQDRKEDVFRTALKLDLERDEFRNTFSGILKGALSTQGGDDRVAGTETTGEGSVTRIFKSGLELTTRIALDLVKLLTQGRSSSLGILADATVSIPLLRGAGRHIAAESLTQAERDMVYAIWEFERYKSTLAVRTAREYLGVLQSLQQVENAEENYRSLVASKRRARRLADAGRLPEFEFDQAVQNELRSRNRWISAREDYKRGLDSFRISLGLPPDAEIDLDRNELERLASSYETIMVEGRDDDRDDWIPPADAPIILEEPEQPTGPMEFEAVEAVRLALGNRLDLRTSRERVYDAQRSVVVAADALRAELTLLGSAQTGERRSIGSADSPNADIDFDKFSSSAILTLDLPIERTAERNRYRESFITLEKAVRDFQDLEDQIKLEVRNNLRDFRENRETVRIQLQAVKLAENRVKSTNLFLQAGRAQIRDLLDAQEALISARNALTSAVVSYRVAELELQRDLGLLQVNSNGLWKEYHFKEGENVES